MDWSAKLFDQTRDFSVEEKIKVNCSPNTHVLILGEYLFIVLLKLLWIRINVSLKLSDVVHNPSSLDVWSSKQVVGYG